MWVNGNSAQVVYIHDNRFSKGALSGSGTIFTNLPAHIFYDA